MAYLNTSGLERLWQHIIAKLGDKAAVDHTHPAQTDVSGNAGTATALQTARSINGMSFDGTTNIISYGVCQTAAATADKVVTLRSGTLALERGTVITVQFNYANTAAEPTLNVNGTGAKKITYKLLTKLDQPNRIGAGAYSFVYTGAAWNLIGQHEIDATTSKRGLMSAADKTKLDGVSEGAKNISLYSISLPADGWESRTDGSYVQIYSDTSLLQSSYGNVDIDMSAATPETVGDLREAWFCVDRCTIDSGNVLFYCYSQCPAIDMTVNLQVIK